MSNETRFTINCYQCGEVDLTADQIWLVLPSGADAHYDFFCPGCDAFIQHEIDAESFDLLAPLVAVEEIDVPAEAQEEHDGPALTVDDLLDFVVELKTDSAAWSVSFDRL